MVPGSPYYALCLCRPGLETVAIARRPSFIRVMPGHNEASRRVVALASFAHATRQAISQPAAQQNYRTGGASHSRLSYAQPSLWKVRKSAPPSTLFSAQLFSRPFQEAGPHGPVLWTWAKRRPRVSAPCLAVSAMRGHRRAGLLSPVSAQIVRKIRRNSSVSEVHPSDDLLSIRRGTSRGNRE